VKIGYLQPELYNMRADWIMALTPGGVDEDMKDPDLSAQWVPSSDRFK